MEMLAAGRRSEMMEWVEYITSDSDSTLANLRRQNGREKPWKLAYFGVGNESWGCGGNMRAEYYADNFRRYRTFVKNYSGNEIYSIACGSNGEDYQWTEALMSVAGSKMNGLSLHWYSLPTGNWAAKGSSTDFGEDGWHSTLRQTLRMEELIAEHSRIMDKHDPKKAVGMIVDEWGTWYDAEPGSEPGFLYQQNTLARCDRGRRELEYFPSALRSCGDDEHRADGECVAGDDFDGQGEDDRHADV